MALTIPVGSVASVNPIYATKGVNTDITSLNAVTGVGGSAFGFRNKLINGSFDVWQRGTSYTNQTISGIGKYVADRWAGNRASDVNGQNISQYTITSTDRTSAVDPIPRYGYKWQRAASDTALNGMYLFYSMETQDSMHLAGQNVVLSFYAKSGTNYSGSYLNVAVLSGTGTDQPVYSMTGATAVLSSTATLTNGLTRYTYTGAVPTTSTQIGLQLSWTPSGTAGADDAVYITGVQLEIGTVATKFEQRPFQTELALCQRYFERITGATQSVCTGAGATATQAMGFIRFGITKRAAPSCSAAGTAGSFQVYSGGGSVVCNALPTFTINNTAPTPQSIPVIFNTASGIVATQAYLFMFNDSTCIIDASAEL